MASLISWAKKRVQQVEHNITHNPVTNAVGNVEKAAFHTVAQAPQYANPAGAIRGVGQVIGQVAPHIPTFPNSSPLRFANQAVIKPLQTTGVHIGQAANGQNPYHGSIKQQLGQAGQDALTLGSALPVGRGADIALKGASLLTKIGQGTKLGIKAGGGFGAVQGLSSSLQHNANLEQTLKNTGISTLAGAGLGAGLGVAAPVIGTGVKAGVKGVQALKPLDQAGKIKLPSLGGQNLHYSSGNGITKISGKANQVRAQLKALNEVGGAKAGNILPDKAFPKPKFANLDEALENTQLNPSKVSIPEVRPGDYGRARINPQQASKPIEFATAQTVNAAKKLSKDEQKNIPHLVENPSLAKTPAAKAFVARHNQLTNLTHATSQALGGNTNFVPNYFRHAVDLAKPEDAARWEKLVNERGGSAADPYAFGGVDNMNRVFKNVKDLQAAGFHLKNENNPIQNITDYGKSSSNTLRRQALVKGVTEADMNAPLKNRNFDLGNGQVIPVSEEGLKQIRSYGLYKPSTNKAIRGARTVNTGLKSSILSAGQFHPFNISILRAGPSTALAGHPIAAAKGVARTFRPLFPGGKGAVDRVMQKALDDGMVEKAAKIGAPYGQAGYETAGTALKSGVGHKLVFERQMPMMHDQVVRSVIKDLEKKGVSLDSEEARQAGIAANSTMGFINKEVLNISPKVRQGMADWMLASQFTPSKAVTLSKVGKKGVAGKYARSDVASNAIAATAIISGIGYALNQKSDSIRDSILRALVNPAVPTPMKDSKGNNIELRVPLTYTGEISHLLGIKLDRQKDGHLGVRWEPTKVLKPDGTVAEWMRSRLSPLPSTGIKLATNTNFAQKQLYDTSAQGGKKAIQAGTTIAQGFLPIGAQGLPNTKIVKEHLPGSAREILNANTPGSNPLIKSSLSSIGFSPRTDQTVGKGLATAQYFAAKDKFTSSLNPNEKALFDTVNPVKKNPVTKQPMYDSTVFNKAATYNVLADNPKFAAKYQAFMKSQPQHDPLWDLSKQQLQSVLLARGGKTYPGQTYTKAGASLSQATGTDQQWYKDLLNKEKAFYSNLPKGGGSSSPKADYGPQPNPYVSQQLSAKNYQDPQVQQYLNDKAAYTNSQRQKTGLAPIAPFGQVGVPGQLDNPAQLAITPKGSTYGTGAPKTSKAKNTGGRVATGRSRGRPKSSFPKLKIAKTKKINVPKGVKIKKLAYKSPKVKKLNVSKIPKIA